MKILLIVLLITNILTVLYIVFSYKPNEKSNSKTEQYIQKQLENILDTMHQAILLFNHKSKLLFYNKDAEKILKLTPDYIKMHAISIFDSKEIRDAIINQNEGTNFDIIDGNKVYAVNIYTFKEKSKRKDRNSVIVILKNVTEHRSIEKTKKDFFSHGSHELKSPLTAIIGYSELATLKMIAKDDYEEIFNRIYKQAMHMSLLVDEMSELSRLELAPEDDHMVSVDLEKVLNSVVESLYPFSIEKNIDFVIESEPIFYVSNELDINKLFKNLVENAIKYSPKDTTVYIDLYRYNDEIKFMVKDQGIGILPKHQQRIFERFYRIDKGRLVSGTGLGLAIVKHILIKYKGEINIESQINEGSKITVTLKNTNKAN